MFMYTFFFHTEPVAFRADLRSSYSWTSGESNHRRQSTAPRGQAGLWVCSNVAALHFRMFLRVIQGQTTVSSGRVFVCFFRPTPSWLPPIVTHIQKLHAGLSLVESHKSAVPDEYAV